MVFTWKRFILLLLILGVSITILGIVFNPTFVAKYVKGTSELSPNSTKRVINYQLYTIIFGCILVLATILFVHGKYGKYLIIPILIVYYFIIHNIYIDKKYPNNLFLNPAGLKKTWSVLLGNELVLSDYQPKSMLLVRNRQVLKAKYPVIDIHFHLDSLKNMNAEELIKKMDSCGIDKIVNLDGSKYIFEKYKTDFKDKYPNRIILFGHLSYWELYRPDFRKEQLELFDKMLHMGAQGLKVWKDLGLKFKDPNGKFVPLDDPRLDLIWDRAGELGIPVLMHTADPTPFFTPIDRFNERYEELAKFPGLSYLGPEFPTKEALLSQRENLLKKHPRTIFIGAHMGMTPENLEYVGYLLDTYPNYYVDIAAVLPELGRQPYTARKFFIKYQDRILFGTDGGYMLGTKDLPAEKFYGTYFEFLETSNEYFEYPLSDIYSQGRWRIYGIELPDEVLKKIYYKNAEKLLFNKPSISPQ
jgi:predicted TIM-barrel fold metal-dependent hydrolase